MDRYRSYGEKDDRPKEVGDGAFLGVDEYNAAENIRQGNVQKAVNHDFTAQDANTRGGFVCLPELGNNSFGQRWDFVNGASINLRDVTYGQGLWVAVGDTVNIRTSPDAITWTTRISPLTTGTLIDIAFANSVFVAVVSSAPNRAIWSSDGITWNLPTIEPAITGGAGIAYGNGKWVISAGTSSSISTDNGVTWTSYSFTSIGTVTGLSFTNGLFVASTATGVAYSADAISWISVAFGPDGTPRDICFFGTKFYLVTSTGAIYSSPTAQTWTLERAAPGGAAHDAIVATESFMVTLGFRSSLCESVVSLNGTEWQVTATGVSTRAFGMGYGNGMVVGVGPTQGAIRSQSIVPAIFASGLFSDPLEKDRPWIMAVATDKVGFFAFGKASKSVSLGSYRVTQQATIVQANNYVYLFRGENQTPLRWDGSWDNDFELVPNTTLPASFASIPNSNQATFYQNRLWVRDGKDSIAASDVLAFTDYDPQANEFNLNTGNSDYIVATFPFGTNTLVVFKNKSIIALNNVEGSLLDVTATEVTRQVGLVGINAITSIGPDLAYVSYGNINLLTLTSTNNALQHKTLPLSAKIRKIMQRVNWNVGYKISLGYWSNKLYVALPLDASPFCNAVVVYNFITEQWFGEWVFNSDMNMCIQGWQVTDYLGLQRLHAITEDGRIFVTDEGQNDISGTTVSEISTELVTRAYVVEEGNHFQRRIYLDLATNRPQFSCATYTEGASEESVLVTDQTYSRAESWKWADSAYDLTNVNNDYNRAYRKDYATGPDSIQSGTGFQPEMLQELRLPLLVRRQGRLSWIKVTNTQGFISVMSLAFETRSGQRANFVQV
jgi:hypothetical protein